LATATGLLVAAKAQRRGAQGVVMMNDVTLSRTRQVLSMAIAITSGHADLDAQAQAWVTRAEPLPAFPPEITVQ
jgi:protein TonB